MGLRVEENEWVYRVYDFKSDGFLLSRLDRFYIYVVLDDFNKAIITKRTLKNWTFGSLQ
jgi:hypothetical protein